MSRPPLSAPKIFLSYNSVDRTSVIAVQRLLEARDITTFLDRDHLLAGLPWPQALEESLRGVCAAAVFIGRELGGWQKREMWFALDRQVREEREGRTFPVIPVLLPGADLTPGFLFSNTWIDLRGGMDGTAAAEAQDAFERAINNTERAKAPERPVVICPYRGLQAFREEDAAFFFGRKAFVDRLLRFTLDKDLVAIVGPSGSGKSSVVEAGLLPLLRRERPPASTWDAISFTPGNDPFYRLASALTPLVEPNKDEVARLVTAQELGKNVAASRIKIEAVISRVIEKSNGTGRLLLVVDQFEELLTLTPEPARRPFAQALLRALGSAPFTLLVTLRADFYSQIITLDRELSDRLATAQVNIGALTQDELRDSVTEPARLVGLDFESGLVDRILTEIGSEPGRLPLVEFTLTELWQRREGNRLANRTYDEIEGVTGALAQRAEAEFARLKPEEQTVARRLFGRLVRVARPEEGGDDTRRRADLSETDILAKGVATQLANARLLVIDGDESARSVSVELAHEALIRNWRRLQVWLNEDREFLLWQQRLQLQAREWQWHTNDAGYLLRSAPLAEAERWLLDRPQDLTDAEVELIRESIALRGREQEEAQQRHRAELENAQRLKEAAEARAEAEKRRATTLRRLSLGVTVTALLALLGAAGFWAREQARSQRDLLTRVGLPSSLYDISHHLDQIDLEGVQLPDCRWLRHATTLTLDSEVDQSCLSPNLTSLSLVWRNDVPKQPTILPRSLTSLSLSGAYSSKPVWNDLPNTLTQLSLAWSGSHQPPPWTLPTSLESLDLRWSESDVGPPWHELPRNLRRLSLEWNRAPAPQFELPPLLTSLSLSWFGTKRPPQWNKLPAGLTHLSLSWNDSEGEIPLQALPAGLKDLELDWGTLGRPPSWTVLPAGLRSLSLTWRTNLEFPLWKEYPSGLESLSIDWRGSGMSPSQWSVPQTLKSLSLTWQLDREAPWLAEWPKQLTSLSLAWNFGEGPSFNELPPNLTDLSLSWAGSDAPKWRTLPKPLKSLSLAWSGGSLPWAEAPPGLASLALKWMGATPPQWHTLPPGLEALTLEWSGVVPESLGRIPSNVKRITIHKLTGP